MEVFDTVWPEEELWKGSDSSVLNLVARELSPQQVVPTSSPEHAPESSAFSPELLAICEQDLFQPLFLDSAVAEQLSPASSPFASSPDCSDASSPVVRSKRCAAPSFSTKPTKKIAKASGDGKPKRKRKRAKHVPTAVIISSVELKTMTCEEIDLMAAEIEQKRSLTLEEDADFKSYKRRIMNRESAKESRQKKQELIKDISDALQASKEHSYRLERRIRLLEEENAKLRLSVAHPSVKTVPATDLLDEEMSECSSPGSSGGSSEEGSPPSPTSFWSLGQASLPGKAGVCLFVVLLSFGLMFTAIQPGDFSNHSQLSALAPLMLQQSTGRAITNEQFVSASQMDKLTAIASGISRSSLLEAGVHNSRDLLHYEPLPPQSMAMFHEAEEVFDVHHAANSTTRSDDAMESYGMDISVEPSGVSVVFSSLSSGHTQLELDVHFIEVAHGAKLVKEAAGVFSRSASVQAEGPSISC